MRTHRTLVLAPLLDQYPGLFQRAENFTIERLVPDFAVEAFIASVLPWATWLDEQRLHTDPGPPNFSGPTYLGEPAVG